ncbi:MAG TPA: CehA/McbA family metallohydrolase [archaeon]|nr:CehA/McbA family metallohydrolase [archaeon]
MLPLAELTMDIELHCHSWHSRQRKVTWEGTAPPAALVRAAAAKGLGAIALTDHDSVAGWAEAAAEARRLGLLFIPGEEVTTERGHIVGLGLSELVPPKLSVAETVDRIHAQGGVAIASHPFDIKGDGVRHEARRADAIEVFNSLNLDRFANRVAKRKAAAWGLPAVAASDAHLPEAIGLCRNRIAADGLEGVLRAIKKGRVEFEASYIPTPLLMQWVQERLSKSYADVSTYVHARYSGPKAWLATTLLQKYVAATGRMPWWNLLARFGLTCARGYGAVHAVRYY